jgi:peptide chain release factor 1
MDVELDYPTLLKETQAKLDIIEKEKKELEKKLQDESTVKNAKTYKKVSKNYNDTKEKFDNLKLLEKALSQYLDTEELVESESDGEMKDLAESELESLKNKIFKLNEKQIDLETEEDPMDSGNAIIEIRAGAGGEEAALFAQELYRAFTKFAESEGFKVEIASVSYASAGGFKEIVFFISGDYAYQKFKYESGVHRVQRVPETESSGRIHTSAVSVVVLPESEDIEIEINEADLRIDVYRSSGPGGQSVNTTDSAVRIVHEPTDIVVTCQDEKSQHKNKAKAMKILQAKLYDLEKQKQQKEISKMRQSAISSGDRSAKIRTYNFPQSRVTDHRIKESWHNLSDVMEGEFSEIVATLAKVDRESQRDIQQA